MFATVKNVPFSEKNIFINFLPVFLYILPTEISKSDSISGPKLGPKGSERFTKPLNWTSNLRNLQYVTKNRTLNLPNLKKPNLEPNQVWPNATFIIALSSSHFHTYKYLDINTVTNVHVLSVDKVDDRYIGA